MSKRWIAAGYVAAQLVGCAPQVSQLVADKHYREAVCAAHDVRGRRSQVSAALFEDSNLHLHVHRVTQAELEPVIGGYAEDVLERVDFVRIRVQTNDLPLDAYEVEVEMLAGGTQYAGAPVSWETLAHATQERLPARLRGETYLTLGNMLRASAAVLTAGLSLTFTRFRKRAYEYDAPLSEYQRVAPHAAALFLAMHDTTCTNGSVVSPRCGGFYVVDNAPEIRWSLELTERYITDRSDQDLPTCTYTRVSKVDLGPMPGFGEVFGPRMRSAKSLPTHVVDQRWNRVDR